MKRINQLIFTLTAFFLLTLSALAGEVVVNSTADNDSPDQQLNARYDDFMQFAHHEVENLNLNHKFSRSRMQITKLPDGTYRALFHQIDDSKLTGKVRRSSSKTVPFVGILSYQEEVFEAFGKTKKECSNGKFDMVSVTPNKHIFSYKKGLWD